MQKHPIIFLKVLFGVSWTMNAQQCTEIRSYKKERPRKKASKEIDTQKKKQKTPCWQRFKDKTKGIKDKKYQGFNKMNFIFANVTFFILLFSMLSISLSSFLKFTSISIFLGFFSQNLVESMFDPHVFSLARMHANIY